MNVFTLAEAGETANIMETGLQLDRQQAEIAGRQIYQVYFIKINTATIINIVIV